MGRFLKMNDDIQRLGQLITSNQKLCKLIHYSNTSDIFNLPDINGNRDVLHKRLLLFTHKMPIAIKEGTCVLVRPDFFSVTRGGDYMRASLLFDVYVHEGIRRIYYEDDKGEIKAGDRAILILDMIDEMMSDTRLSIGRNDLQAAGALSTREKEFTGFGAIYNDVDFRGG